MNQLNTQMKKVLNIVAKIMLIEKDENILNLFIYMNKQLRDIYLNILNCLYFEAIALYEDLKHWRSININTPIISRSYWQEFIVELMHVKLMLMQYI